MDSMKMSLKEFFVSMLLFYILMEAIKCDDICESLVPDAITRLQNKSIVVFQSKNVWIFDRNKKQLWGPCPTGVLFKGISGTIDAAVTFENNKLLKISEFIGASIYFGQGKFHTYKNMRPYQVEWGFITYLPVSGKQTAIGSSESENVKHLMSKTMSAAYFDPISARTIFVFSDGTVLSYTFEFDYENDVPDVSTLENEFKKFGISDLPKNVSSALTITQKKNSSVFLFYGSQYCEIQMDVKKKHQNCTLSPVSEFFDCKNLNPTKALCSDQVINKGNPITVQTPKQKKVMTEPIEPIEDKKSVKVRNSDNATNSHKPGSGVNPLLSGYVLTKFIPFLLLLFA